MRHRPRSTATHGFTLIELMIAVAIIGILSAIAIPQYRDYVTRSRLADASAGLTTMRAQMERYYQDNRTYASIGTFVTPCATTAASSRTFGNFVISCDGTPDATQFTLKAEGGGPVSGFTFTINQQDARGSTVPSTWGTSCATKWIMKKAESC